MRPYLFFTGFAERVDPVILQCGWDCYLRQDVRKLKQVSPGHWTSNMRGERVFWVEVKAANREVTLMDCDCPSGKKTICKHIVAMLYEIEERFSEGVEPDAMIRVPILLRYKFRSTKQNTLGYPDRNIDKALKTIDQFLSEATTLNNNGNSIQALDICQGLIREIIAYVSDHPDEGDHFNYTCNTISELILKIIQHGLPEESQASLLDFFLIEYQKLTHIDFALYPGTFFNLPAVLDMNPVMEARYFDFFAIQEDYFIKKDSYKNPLLSLVAGMAENLRSHNRISEGIELLEKYQNDHFILNLLIEAEINQKNFEKARQLALGDLAKKEKKLYYNPQRYQDLLRIAVDSKNLDDTRFYAERCYWQTHNNIEYYRILKNSFPDPEESKQISEYILGKLGIKRKFVRWKQIRNILEILEEEHRFGRMLEFLERQLHEIELIRKYSNQLYQVDRNRYFNLVSVSVFFQASIKKVRSATSIIASLHELEKFDGGKEVASEIASALFDKHADKPFMLEQLKEVFPEVSEST